MNGPTPVCEEKQPTSQSNDKDYIIAFTFAPKPIYQRNNPREGYKIHLQFLLLLPRVSTQFTVHPELFTNGGLHYHAYLVIKDKIKWFKQVLPTFKRHGFVCVKEFRDDKWLEYIKKDWDTVKAVLDLEKPIDLDTLKCKRVKMPKDLKQDIHIKRSNREDFFEVLPNLERKIEFDDMICDTDSESESTIYNQIEEAIIK